MQNETTTLPVPCVPSTVPAPISSTKTPRAAPRPFVSIVVPTYREAANVRELVQRIADALQYEYPTYEIVFVDDNSRDGIDAEVKRLQAERYPVRLIVRTAERGLGTAVMRGFDEALGDVLVCMDADLSHPPEKLPELIARVESPGTEFAIGSRYVRGGGTDSNWSWFRHWNSRVATWLARPFSKAKDPLAGFFAVPRVVFQRCAPLDPVGYKIGLEILVKANCHNVGEVPIQFADRTRGESKLTLAEQFRYLRHLKRLAEFKYRRATPLLLFCMVGATGTVIDLAGYAVLLAAAVPVPLARAAAIGMAMTWNYTLDRNLTFRNVAKPGVWKAYGRFVASCSLGAMLSWALAMVLPVWFELFETHLVGAAAMGVVAGTLANFHLSRTWAFCRHAR